MAQKVTPRSQDYSRWYTDVVQMAELADHAPVKGCMVIRPYGYALWENVKGALDLRIKETGHENAYFPLFIPMSFIERESEHVEGFAPELAVVTHGGGKELEEPVAVRPTSETVIGEMYAKWINSYRDLPVLINQWANVVRWEKRPRLFLRTSEFLWQEGHTAHETQEEAEEETRRMLEVYADFAENEAAIPVIKGLKSESEKFAGAVASYSIEAMMGNGWALQSGTSHFLGQNFAKAFNINYLDRNNKQQFCWTTSWGVSTRMVGGIVMVHGDDQGLILPPRVAPLQVVVVPIGRTDEDKAAVRTSLDAIEEELKGIRYKVDDREGQSPGWKFNEWEMKGVPLRIEIGPRDAASNEVVLARRDRPGKEGKESAKIEGLGETVREKLEELQKALLQRAKDFAASRTQEVESYDQLVEAVGTGFALAPWCGDPEDETKLKEDAKATSRCIPLGQEESKAPCAICGKEGTRKTIFARAY